MLVMPLTLAQANDYVARLHRHHKPVQGHRFSIGVCIGVRDIDCCVGCAIVGRPMARGCDPYRTAEITRLVTDGTSNACSFLYAACARICREMGFDKIQTYILESEPGTSLIAAGWIQVATTQGGDWNHSKQYAGNRRTDQPMVPKRRYEKNLL